MHTLLYLLLFNLFSPLLVEYTLYKLVILLLFFAGFEIQHVAQLVQQDLGTQKFEVYTVLLSFYIQKWGGVGVVLCNICRLLFTFIIIE